MKWNLKVDEDGVLTFPDDLLEITGWVEGDVLEWIDNLSLIHISEPTRPY